MARKITLRELPDHYAVCKLAPEARIPAWADGDGFLSISRTPDELSIVCRSERVPPDVHAARDWRCFALIGPFAFDETGIAVSVIAPLSDASIGIFLVATFDTDYLLIQGKDLEAGKRALLAAGHTLR
jgi:uncharacterized protein